MIDQTLVVPVRESFGKAATRELKQKGLIPAVVYGLGEPPVPVAISPKAVAKVIGSEAGLNSVMFLQREGTDIKRHVILKEVQRHPVTGRLLHVDFMRVDMSLKVRVKIPILLTGVAVGVKTEGGVLDFPHREVEVECLPSIIPSNVSVDITNLRIGDMIRFEQITLIANVTLVSEAHEAFVTIHGKPVTEEIVIPLIEPEVVAVKGKKPKK